MKTPRVPGIFGILTVVFLIPACVPDRPESLVDDGEGTETSPPPKPEGPPKIEIEYPFQRKLINDDGREVAGTILAKQASLIAFRRAADNKEFLIRIENLSEADQKSLNGIADGDPDEFARVESGGIAARPDRKAMWRDNYRSAINEALNERLGVFLLFTGSDWCPPCKDLQKRILRSEEFLKFADQNLVLIKIDFPRKTALDWETRNQNESLQKQFNVTSFPTVFIMDGREERKLQFTGYRGQRPAEYVGKIREALRNSPPP